MRLSPIVRLALTQVLGKKRKVTRPRTDEVLVRCRSVVSDFQVERIRPKQMDKLEFICWDPLVQQDVLYREHNKIATVRQPACAQNQVHHFPIYHNYPVVREKIFCQINYPNEPPRFNWRKTHELVEA